jgi:hypothetical protein
MNIGEICTLVVTIIGVIPTVVSLVAYIVKSIKNKDWSAILTITQKAMSEVESASKDTANTSEEKLNMAIKIIKNSCEASNIKCDDDTITKVTAYITEMCKWAKSVNSGK